MSKGDCGSSVRCNRSRHRLRGAARRTWAINKRRSQGLHVPDRFRSNGPNPSPPTKSDDAANLTVVVSAETRAHGSTSPTLTRLIDAPRPAPHHREIKQTTQFVPLPTPINL